MTISQKKTLWRIIASAVLFALAIAVEQLHLVSGWMLLLVYLPPYVLIGGDVILNAFRGVFSGELLDENFLMSIATVGAFIIGEYPEGVGVMLFYQVGALFEDYAVGKSRKSITDLMDIRPDYANIYVDGQITKVSPEKIRVGDEIIVLAGEKVPLDGIVIEGRSNVDTSAITGESVPRTVDAGDEGISGFINLSSILKIRVTKEFSESTVSKILELVENASGKKANVENFITRFARFYTPIVVVAAFFLAIIPPLIIKDATFSVWAYRALNFLVISCPCALVISVPLSFFGGIGAASKQGILVKGSNYMEALSKVSTVVFDKTGTLTKGKFEVVEVQPAENITKDELIELAAMAESYSNHPISASLRKYYGKSIDQSLVSNFEDLAGRGIKADFNGKTVYAGNISLMESLSIKDVESNDMAGTIVYLASDGKYAGKIVIADEIKPNAKETISKLKAKGIKTVMLSGDVFEVAQHVAGELGIDKTYAELKPADKVEKFEEIIDTQDTKTNTTAFVGDGINDAPVLGRADVGISMGSIGSDAAVEASDVVIMHDNLDNIPLAVDISKYTLGIVKQNIVFILAIKTAFLILSAVGRASMWQAVFADVGVSVIAILNSMRALRYFKKR